MNGGRKKNPDKRIVCFCYSISEEEIVTAIREGATTLMEIRRATNANTGCGGCGEDVKKLIRKHVVLPTDPSVETTEDNNDE